VNRRKFLKRAAVTSVALGSVPLAGGEVLAADGKRKGYHFLVLSRDAGGTGPEGVIISGDGAFGSGDVTGGGLFDHFRFIPPPPLPIVGTGTWKAKKFVSFTLAPVHPPSNPEGRHGVFQAGILKMTADFSPRGGGRVKGVALEVVCNLGPAGATNPGKEEGVTITLPDGHEFEPQKPTTLGVTAFSTSDREDDD
jgi:hypothetical protein